MNPRSFSVLLVASLLGSAASIDDLIQPLSKDNSEQCGCYLVSGPDPAHFQYHRFWDFRSIPNDGDNDYSASPPVVSDAENQGGQPATSALFASKSWLNDWSFLDGANSPFGTIPNIYSEQNVYISRNTTGPTTFLALRAARLSSFMSTSQITSSQRNLLHASIRTRMRIIPNSELGSNSSDSVDGGAVVGVFTYQSDTQESDIEILTRDSTDQIRYSSQPDYDDNAGKEIPGASTKATLPQGLRYTDWIEHRLDWLDGVVRWYVNDVLVLNKTVNAPTQPSGLILNVWGDNGDWSGNMSVGGQVTAAFEYIEMVFNVSGPASGEKSNILKERDSNTGSNNVCTVACSIDGVKAVGFPELASQSKAAGMRVDRATWWYFVHGLFVATILYVLIVI